MSRLKYLTRARLTPANAKLNAHGSGQKEKQRGKKGIDIKTTIDSVIVVVSEVSIGTGQGAMSMSGGETDREIVHRAEERGTGTGMIAVENSCILSYMHQHQHSRLAKCRMTHGPNAKPKTRNVKTPGPEPEPEPERASGLTAEPPSSRQLPPPISAIPSLPFSFHHTNHLQCLG